MEIQEIEHKIACREMTAEQVFTQMNQHVAASQRLCAIYFSIATEILGEKKVRELRDHAIAKGWG